MRISLLKLNVMFPEKFKGSITDNFIKERKKVSNVCVCVKPDIVDRFADEVFGNLHIKLFLEK